jgi:hypothetical protein
MPSAIAEYSKAYRRDQILGRPRQVPSELIVNHVRDLQAAGATLGTIAHASGVPLMTVSNVSRNLMRSTRTGTAKRLLATTLRDVIQAAPPECLVPALGAIRRVQALLAIGHTYAAIASFRDNTDATVLWKLLRRETPGLIRKYLHDQVCVAYEALSMTPGRSDRTRQLAKQRCYHPPLAWDEGALDDPDARPHGSRIRLDVVDEVAVRRRMEGEHVKLTQAEAREVVRRLYGQGLSSPQIATRTGLKAERYLTKREWLEAS